MRKPLISTLTTLAILAAGASDASTQNFSCLMGKQPACLDYGDKVCSSSAKCVDENAACFDTYQCNYEGFTCKSNVTELAEKYDGLVGDYNDLLAKSRSLADDFDAQASRIRVLANENSDLKSGLDSFETCVRRSSTIEDAQNCSY